MSDTICDTSFARGRIEIRTGVGRRRRWAAEEKGRIVAEAISAGVPVSEVARRHDMSAQHLFHWVRAAREGRLALPAEACPGSEGMMFVPIVAETEQRAKPAKAAISAASIEIAIEDFVVRAARGVDLGLLVDVLRAVKAAA
ncbi:MAG: IS66-like element accessory protein TnpA [Rhizomicrobium sp.]